MLRGLLFVAALFWVYSSLAQKTLTAIKTLQAPVIDGKLDDTAWQQAALATNFIQNTPLFGQPSTVKTEVRILYDNTAVYIGAYLYDNQSFIARQLTPRDGELGQNTDYFSVFFDTYNDQQNGFEFLVTPGNVQTDARLSASYSPSLGDYGDKSWDAVWQSQTSLAEEGWIVEMRIPYLSLRFAKKDVQTWGVQFLRHIRRNNEFAFWNPVDPNESGFVNQFGKYNDLQQIKPPLRLSFSPYVSGGIRFYPQGYTKDKENLHNGGMDVKYGINESFTLDATVIPDFGQVISDNVVNNLTPYEQQFDENRPFFTEGTELFTKSNLFYSRRIGAMPGDYYDVQSLAPQFEIEKNPTLTQLYNAIKLSGRTNGKLGIGIFNAVTAPMNAIVRNRITKQDSVIETEPLTNYNLIVLDQALKGRSYISFTNTNVIRSGTYRDANVTGLDIAFYTKNNKYKINALGRYSAIFDYTPYRNNIDLVDDTVRVNGETMIKPYDGFKGTLLVGKVSGKIQYNGSVNVESNTYDPNDMGYLPAPNKVAYSATAIYNQLTATDKFIMYRYTLNSRYNYMYKPYAFNQLEFYATAYWVFKNFWKLTLYLGTQPYAQHDYYELRTPRRYLQRPAFHYVSAVGETDSRKKLSFTYQLGYTRTEVEGGDYYLTEGGLRYRFNNRFTLNIDVARSDDQTQIGYAFLRVNGEPIIGYRRNVEATTVLSGIYNFTPRINLTLRTRHYWNQVRYKDFFNVMADGTHAKRDFIPGQDENYNLFNMDAFFTWDFRLGSRLIMGYKNWLGNPYGVLSGRNYFNNLHDLFRVSHGNELTLKFIYFLDYNQFRKKH